MPHEKEAIIRESHLGTAGGHFTGKPTARKFQLQDYGGVLCIKTLRNFVDAVISARG